MQSKLQELTEKIYQEGLEKGNSEAKAIVEKAQEEAKSIVDSAKEEAEKILADARKKAEETKANSETEIKLSSKQAINALKQQIVDIINNKVVEETVAQTFDKDFTKSIIKNEIGSEIFGSFTGNHLVSGRYVFLFLSPADKEKELSDYFKKSVKNVLDKGVEIKFDSSIKAGFQILPKDGSYKVSFTDEDFAGLFRQYLKPKLIEQLF